MKIKKAVFPVAGLGTRFLPVTKACPKEMLPLVDKPLIQYVVEEAIEAGIEEIIMITGRGKYSIEDYFDHSIELEMILKEKKESLFNEIKDISALADFCFVRQNEPLGLGHAVLKARHLIGDEPFAVLLGDDIIHSKQPVIGQLIDVFNETGTSVIAVEEVPWESVSSYGVISVKEKESEKLYELGDMVEKPPRSEAPSNLAIIGRYILTPEIFPMLEKTRQDKSGEIQLTNAMKMLLGTQKISGCQFAGKRYDAGNKLGFLKATVEFALRRDDLGGEFRSYLKELDI